MSRELSVSTIASNFGFKFLAKAIGGCIFISLMSQVSIPLEPVPITLQTLSIAALGLSVGSSGAVASVLLYLLAGASGMPVWAGGGSGLQSLIGPCAGYFIGFIAAAYISGLFAKSNTWLAKFAGALLALTSVLVIGSALLSLFIGIKKAILLGIKPFLIGDLIKALAASLLNYSTSKFISKIEEFK